LPSHLVIIPDLFKGTELPTSLFADFKVFMDPQPDDTIWQKSWAISRVMYYAPAFFVQNSASGGAAIIATVVAEVKRARGIEGKVGLIGYCWGGSIGLLLGAQESGPVDVIAIAHPGGGKTPADYASLVKPTAAILAGKDFTDLSEIEAIANFLKTDKTPKIHHLVKGYPGRYRFRCYILTSHLVVFDLNLLNCCPRTNAWVRGKR
jgi:dienelactone hydrolase